MNTPKSRLPVGLLLAGAGLNPAHMLHRLGELQETPRRAEPAAPVHKDGICDGCGKTISKNTLFCFACAKERGVA